MARAPLKVRANTTRMAEGYGEAIESGLFSPGAGAKRITSVSWGNPLKQVGDALKGMQAKRDSLSDAYENSMAKAKGSANYYNNSPSKTKGILAMRRAGK